MKISNNWWDADGKTIYNLKRAVYYDEAVTKGQTTKSQISQTKGWLKQLASTDNEKQITYSRLWKQRSLWLRCRWKMIINWKYQTMGDGMQKTKRINISIWATAHLPLP